VTIVGSGSITLQFGEETVTYCDSIILVPAIAVVEHGYIRTISANAGAHAKHEFHALAQMAYFQFQDDELEIEKLQGPLLITLRGEAETFVDGLALYRDLEGRLHVIMHEKQDARKLIEAAYRFCTRWVRLDI
jgi:hypothetical protein